MEKVAAGPTAMDKLKLVGAAAILGTAVLAFYALSDQPTLLRVLVLLAALALAAFIAVQTQPGRALWAFLFDVRTEVRKVVWPTREETTQTTLVVVAMVAVMAILLWLIDMILFALMRFLTGQGG